MKLGEEIPREEFGEYHSLFTGEVRLLKAVYIIQDEVGLTTEVTIEHKDFIREDKENKE